jgi:hypothetical protein
MERKCVRKEDIRKKEVNSRMNEKKKSWRK